VTRRRLGRIAVVVAAVGLALVIAGVAVWSIGLWRGVRGAERIEDPFAALPTRPPVTASPSERAPVNILMLGSDSRISAGDPSQWAYGAQRTDAIMLLHIPGDRQGAYVLSIPRDSWVPIPGYGEAKINAAFSWGGPALMIETVEALTGVRIDHFMVADFESFAALTDAVGGVEITIPADTYANGQRTFAAGTYLMDGEEALRYARQRYGLPGGDFDRIQRQQNWMRAIARSAFQRDVLGNPAELLVFLRTAAQSVAVDEGLDLNAMRGLAMTMTEVPPENVVFLTVPTAGTGRSPDGQQSIVVVDHAGLDPLMRAVAEDRLGEYLMAHGGQVQILTESVN